MMSEWIASFFLIAGALFMLIASIGVLKLKDAYQRMHAVTKAPSLGAVLMILSTIVYFHDVWLAIEGLLVIAFIFMTNPLGTHMLGRVSHLMHIQKSNDTILDEFVEEEPIQHSNTKLDQ